MTKTPEALGAAVHYQRHDLRVAVRRAPLLHALALAASLAAAPSACGGGGDAKEHTVPPVGGVIKTV